ncbi:NRDE family protein [Marinobacter sp. BGYM27]|uniref:NRDE family protein n=1 Tax=Marinobacter sp. BGYM27 TaxID=2975597 RepID=UPI0021A7A663|nr:NRDE family protein [Marinobacter sp. BGYM27]MDG5498129.1 NRDE family protein [Marinobacter sp. BGYM27]
MCLILFAINQHPELPLVVAANRDEYYQRPTDPMHWWSEQEVLAGRDRESGGTWLAISPQGEVAAVTNFRDGRPEKAAISRGQLPLWALDQSTTELGDALQQSRGKLAGFNLICVDSKSGWYFSNRDPHPGRNLHRGAYGLSNHLLQSPWPKLVTLRKRLTERLQQVAQPSLHEQLIADMQDTAPAPDQYLPDTGVGLETERFLSSPFIKSEHYGTRATTIITVAATGDIRVTEQSWEQWGAPGKRQTFQWQRQPFSD